jgi:hypothetical protein
VLLLVFEDSYSQVLTGHITNTSVSARLQLLGVEHGTIKLSKRFKEVFCRVFQLNMSYYEVEEVQ